MSSPEHRDCLTQSMIRSYVGGFAVIEFGKAIECAADYQKGCKTQGSGWICLACASGWCFGPVVRAGVLCTFHQPWGGGILFLLGTKSGMANDGVCTRHGRSGLWTEFGSVVH